MVEELLNKNMHLLSEALYSKKINYVKEILDKTIVLVLNNFDELKETSLCDIKNLYIIAAQFYQVKTSIYDEYGDKFNVMKLNYKIQSYIFPEKEGEYLFNLYYFRIKTIFSGSFPPSKNVLGKKFVDYKEGLELIIKYGNYFDKNDYVFISSIVDKLNEYSGSNANVLIHLTNVIKHSKWYPRIKAEFIDASEIVLKKSK